MLRIWLAITVHAASSAAGNEESALDAPTEMSFFASSGDWVNFSLACFKVGEHYLELIITHGPRKQ